MEKSFFKPNFTVLDGIRGIAAFYVVLNHSRGHLLQGGSEFAAKKTVADWSLFEKIYYALLQFTTIGTEFVIVFFVLSGFSIAYSLRNSQKLGGFYLKRLIRLYPPYILALIWAFVVFVLIDKFSPLLNKEGFSVFDNLEVTIKNLLYLNRGNFIPQFWSLIHEVFFYLLIPFALLRIRFYYIISVCLYLIGFFVPTSTINSNILLLFLLQYNIYFVIGVYLYRNYQFVSKYFRIRNTRLLIAALLVLFVATIGVKFKTGGYGNLTFLLASIGSILMIVNFQEKKIINPIIKWLGEMSYTLYITHMASIYLFYLILVQLGLAQPTGKIETWWYWIASIPVTLLISHIYYIIVEKRTKLFLIKIRKQ